MSIVQELDAKDRTIADLTKQVEELRKALADHDKRFVETWNERDAFARRIDKTDAELASAVAAEREACAKVADNYVRAWKTSAMMDGSDSHHRKAAEHIAAAIRARTEH